MAATSVFTSRFKQQARNFALVSAASPVQTALFFPGESLVDVAQARKSGLTNANTKHVLVEQDEDVLRKLRLKAARRLRRLHMHGASLEELSLQEAIGKSQLNYAWLDFCGCLKEGETMWMEDELSPKLAVGATVAITVARTTRLNRFMARAQQTLEACGNQFLTKAHNMLTAAETLNAYPVSNVEYDPAFGEYPALNTVYEEFTYSQRFHASSLLPVSLMLAAMPMWDFDVRTCFEYPGENHGKSGGGGGHMTLVVFDGFRHREESRRDADFEEPYQRLVGRKTWRTPSCREVKLVIQSHFKGPLKRRWSKKRMTEAYSTGERAAITRKVNRLAGLLDVTLSY